MAETEEDRDYDVLLSEGPGLETAKEPKAVMNCWTGVCKCTGLSQNACISECDKLWDANCSKPASEQPGQP
ncbi:MULTISPECIES: hypothetical protein [Polyangium]|uniref:Uncharacterized protein n=2 Tax=Polyangium TaxID=55 RepID=A0A4U1JFM0_9BACT|nr:MULTISPECIES: hypothetical protein [Polyangium]MDI1434838.1 hypothetical protein [Polyangium sorediatum]TKD10049.1 hypothetical protein E8A74_10660 [Polyangium fumosum]